MPLRTRSSYFATCAPGVEPVLHEEARELGLARLERQVGGVYFEGTRADAWRANLRLATAVRVLERVARFEARDGDALHAAATELPWERWLAPEGSLAVQAQSHLSALDHTQFVEQRVKDAIVDRFRARTGARPSVDRDDPDLRVHVHVYKDRATVALDTSGEPLHKRGWRRHQGRAPLAENLAAALLRLSGWDRRAPLVDPFAGSGTILIEGARWAAGLAPGERRTFGCERWLDHDAGAYAAFRARELAPPPARKPPVFVGLELDPERAREANENAEAAGVSDRVRIEVGDARELTLRPGWNAWLVTNAPYGVRIGEKEDPLELLRALGARLRAGGQGTHLAVLVGRSEHAKALGLRGLERHPLVNGGLECLVAVGEV